MPTGSWNSSEIEQQLREILYRLGYVHMLTTDEDALEAVQEIVKRIDYIRGNLDKLVLEEVTELYLRVEAAKQAEEEANRIQDEQDIVDETETEKEEDDQKEDKPDSDEK